MSRCEESMRKPIITKRWVNDWLIGYSKQSPPIWSLGKSAWHVRLFWFWFSISFWPRLCIWLITSFTHLPLLTEEPWESWAATSEWTFALSIVTFPVPFSRDTSPSQPSTGTLPIHTTPIWLLCESRVVLDQCLNRLMSWCSCLGINACIWVASSRIPKCVCHASGRVSQGGSRHASVGTTRQSAVSLC